MLGTMGEPMVQAGWCVRACRSQGDHRDRLGYLNHVEDKASDVCKRDGIGQYLKRVRSVAHPAEAT